VLDPIRVPNVGIEVGNVSPRVNRRNLFDRGRMSEYRKRILGRIIEAQS
jgi:hypothetical protein